MRPRFFFSCTTLAGASSMIANGRGRSVLQSPGIIPAEEGCFMSIEKTYAAQIRNETGKFATWFPAAEVAIGDYGTVSGPLFEKLNRLSGLQASAAPAK